MPIEIIYGVWLTGEGWYKINNDCFAGDAELASCVRDIVGGRVMRIDPSLRAAEADLLKREAARANQPAPKRAWWRK